MVVLAPTLLHSRPQRRIDRCACGWQTRYQWEVLIIDLVGDIPTAQGGGVGVVFSAGDHYPYVGSFVDIAHPVGADHIPVGFIFALRELSFHLTSSIIGENGHHDLVLGVSHTDLSIDIDNARSFNAEFSDVSKVRHR